MERENQNSGLGNFIASEYKNLVKSVKVYLNEKYNNVTAEDIVQDVALNLFTKLDFDANIENIAGYVYQSIKNRATDVKRKPKREILIEHFNDDDTKGNAFFERLLSEAQDTDNMMIDSDLFLEKVNKALEKLPKKQKAVIIATEFEGHSFHSLSHEWNVPMGTLLSWKHRGMTKLKKNIRLDDFYIVNNENE